MPRYTIDGVRDMKVMICEFSFFVAVTLAY